MFCLANRSRKTSYFPTVATTYFPFLIELQQETFVGCLLRSKRCVFLLIFLRQQQPLLQQQRHYCFCLLQFEMNRQSKGQGNKKKRKKNKDNAANTQQNVTNYFGEPELKKRHKGCKLLFNTSTHVGGTR